MQVSYHSLILKNELTLLGLDRTIRPHKKSLVYHPFQLKYAMQVGRFFFKFFYIFFVCPSPAAAYIKAITQSINKTKLLFIDRLGEKAIIYICKV